MSNLVIKTGARGSRGVQKVVQINGMRIGRTGNKVIIDGTMTEDNGRETSESVRVWFPLDQIAALVGTALPSGNDVEDDD